MDLISEVFTVKIGESEIKIYKHGGLKEHSAFLSPDIYDTVKAHFQKESDKTANAIKHN